MNNLGVFFYLIKTGLWENFPVHAKGFVLKDYSILDWEAVYQLATEQSVIGLVLAGIERLKEYNLNVNVPQEILLQWIGEV